ncbi:MAG TPA: SDR family oxidoreductase [Thermoleophilia bacterium]|nr:SDR family oxidoreductase [Thermoleophilia bacterium]
MGDLFSLDGKKAVVVGGAGGMGRGIAAGLADYGADLAIADVNAAALEDAASALKAETGKDVHRYAVDCTDDDSVKALVDAVVKDAGRVDILVNALGINVKAPAVEFPMDQWERLFSVNVHGVMRSSKAFAAQMIMQGGGGKIINLSSVRGQRAALGGNSAYCASKGAVDMITRQLAVELAEHKINVNALGPIITITPMTAERIKNESARYERMLLNVPMGRMCEVADLIGPAVFLASPASDFITGTILYPDGGMMAFA